MQSGLMSTEQGIQILYAKKANQTEEAPNWSDENPTQNLHFTLHFSTRLSTEKCYVLFLLRLLLDDS